jgi:outer membrane protein TolC
LTAAAVLLDAQRRLMIARSSLISVRCAELENRIDLHLALGGEVSAEGTP